MSDEKEYTKVTPTRPAIESWEALKKFCEARGIPKDKICEFFIFQDNLKITFGKPETNPRA